MQVIPDIHETRLLCQEWCDKGESIAFVPTMGCLHRGHLSLVEKATSLADHVVVSIFVNPLQFGENEDFASYPRSMEDDQQKLASQAVDLLCVPTVKDFYPEGESKVERLDFGEITTILEGAERPGHFTGVATVVKRLFEIVQPDIALFGEKDFQQLLLIKQLVVKYSMNIKIIGLPTCREEDGLAMSSRNAYLSPDERKKAPELYRTLLTIKAALQAGRIDYAVLEKTAWMNLEKAGFQPEYIVIRDGTTLIQKISDKENMVILLAARLGKTRLIDNIRLQKIEHIPFDRVNPLADSC